MLSTCFTQHLQIFQQNDEILFRGVCSQIIDNIYCKYFIYDFENPLVVTFAPLGAELSWESVAKQESPWGFEFVRSKKINVISFCCIKDNTWYRSKDFFEFCCKFAPKLSCFPVRLGYASSAGGFALSCYADIFGLNRLLLINPISTLNPSLVPFEKRYLKPQKNLNWNSGAYDGATTKCSGFIIYDPFCIADRKHANRYGQQLLHLKIPFVGHGIPRHLKDMAILEWIFDSFINDRLENETFIKQIRKRRNIFRYYRLMLCKTDINLYPKRIIIILRHINLFLEKNNISIRDLIPKKGLPSFINLIVKYALLIENLDLKKAFELMKIAQNLRPKGRLINDKCNEYEKKLSINE